MRIKNLNEDEETPETELWRQTVEQLLANGSSPVEALDGANLIMQAYRRQLSAFAVPALDPDTLGTSGVPKPEEETTPRASGVRRRMHSSRYKAK